MSLGTGKSRTGRERYVMLRHWLLDSPAWKSLPVGARALYPELARRYNGSNNGRIPYSVREAIGLHISLATASRLLRILQDRGFIVCTKKGAFSLKTTKDASEWLLTEYDSDYPVAHATKEFMRWQMPEGGDVDTLNRQPSHHRKSKTRLPQRKHTVTPVKPHGYPGESTRPKKRKNGYPGETVKAKIDASTVTPVKHLQLPGGCSPPLVPDVTKLPWSTPTLTEISFADLPTELRALALGLPVPEPNGWKVVLEGGAAPSVQPEIEPWPTVVIDGKEVELPF